jgi:phosphate transport system substrate-binding protein
MKQIIRLAAALVLSICLVSTACAEEMIQIKGSDTLINLVQRLAEVYMNEYSDDYIAVTGGGSGTGIAALINNKTDIANASRGMKAKEMEQAVSAGVTPKRVVIAMDGLSVIVNGRSPITSLTIQEIGNIFSGSITNWKEVGGPDMPITLYGRQSNSGTFVFFRDQVVKADYAQTMNRMNGNAQIVEAVKQDESGIGYVGVGYVKNVRGLNVLQVAARAGAPYASPLSSADVKSGNYPIARPLNQYLNGKPEGAVKDFIAFELSVEGQRIVEQEGFFPLPQEYIDYNLESVGL